METNPQAPVIRSVEHYRRLLQQPGPWLPLLQHIAEKHDLGRLGVPEAGVGGTYPTFVAGDLVFKLFGYLPGWRKAFETERRAMRVLVGEPALLVPDLLAQGDGSVRADQSWPYLVTSRMPGSPWGSTRLTRTARVRVAEQLGQQIARLQALDIQTWAAEPPAGAPELISAARRSSLPAHLLPRLPEFVAGVEEGLAAAPVAPVFVHGDLMFRHVFVQGGQLAGVIDWGDAMASDPHYELVQLQLNLFDRDVTLLTAFLQAAQWQTTPDFARRCLLMALRRQAHGLAQHISMDVFYKLPRWFEASAIASPEALARALFAL